VIDQNYVTNGPLGIRIDGGEGNLVTRNRIDEVQTGIRDRGHLTLLNDNKVTETQSPTATSTSQATSK
jgi:hypothetical protein